MNSTLGRGHGRRAQFVAALFLACASAFAPTYASDREACKGDVKTFCKDVKQGGGRVLRCLKANEDKVSDPCKASMKKK